MSSFINVLQSFIQWIYNGVSSVFHLLQSMIGFVNNFYNTWYGPYISTVCPLWLASILTIGILLMVGFLIARLVVNLL